MTNLRKLFGFLALSSVLPPLPAYSQSKPVMRNGIVAR